MTLPRNMHYCIAGYKKVHKMYVHEGSNNIEIIFMIKKSPLSTMKKFISIQKL